MNHRGLICYKVGLWGLGGSKGAKGQEAKNTKRKKPATESSDDDDAALAKTAKNIKHKKSAKATTAKSDDKDIRELRPLAYRQLPSHVFVSIRKLYDTTFDITKRRQLAPTASRTNRESNSAFAPKRRRTALVPPDRCRSAAVRKRIGFSIFVRSPRINRRLDNKAQVCTISNCTALHLLYDSNGQYFSSGR